MIRILLSVPFAIFLSLSLTFSAAQATSILDGDGVLGWGTVTPTGVQWTDSAYAACQIQRNAYAPNSAFQGASSGFPSAGCQWATVIGDSYPAVVTFWCATGYSRLAPGRCVKDEDAVNQDCEKCGNPVGLLSGRKFESARDWATADGLISIERKYLSTWYSQYYLPEGTLRGAGITWAFDFFPTLKLRHNFTFEPSVALFLPEGQYFVFDYDIYTGQFVPANGVNFDAKRFSVSIDGGFPVNWGDTTNASRNWTIVDNRTGKTYHYKTFPDPQSSSYTIGYPTQVDFRGGYQWTLSYGATGNLTQLVDNFGRQLSFTWAIGNNFGQSDYPAYISRIDLPDGSSLKYSYAHSFTTSQVDANSYDRLAGVQHVVSATGSGPTNLITATDYHYEDLRFPWLLTASPMAAAPATRHSLMIVGNACRRRITRAAPTASPSPIPSPRRRPGCGPSPMPLAG